MNGTSCLDKSADEQTYSRAEKMPDLTRPSMALPNVIPQTLHKSSTTTISSPERAFLTSVSYVGVLLHLQHVLPTLAAKRGPYWQAVHHAQAVHTTQQHLCPSIASIQPAVLRAPADRAHVCRKAAECILADSVSIACIAKAGRGRCTDPCASKCV